MHPVSASYKGQAPLVCAGPSAGVVQMSAVARSGQTRKVPWGLTSGQRRRLTLIAMCMSQGMILLDVTIVNIALPSIQRELHMSAGRLEWVISAYALTLATLIPLGGALGDRFGRKRLFLVGLTIFTVASALCAISTVDIELIAFRTLQGVGGAFLMALTLSIISETYPPKERAGAIGIWAAAAGLGFGSGPVVGGLLLSTFDWSSIFWVNVPVGLIAIGVAMVGVNESRDPAARRLDGRGLFFSAIGLFFVTFALVESADRSWLSTEVIVAFLLGLIVLGVFVIWERRIATPMLPPSLFRARSFRAACSVYVLAYLALTGFMFFVTLLFQDVKGWSALRTGLSWIAMNIPFIVASRYAGRLSRRFSAATIVGCGCVLAAAGVLGMSQITSTTSFPLAGLWYVLLGTGFGTFVPAITNVAMIDVPEGFSGIAAGVLNASRQIGTSIGLAVLGTIGVNVTRSDWLHYVDQLPANRQAAARSVSQSVTGAQIHTVEQALGSNAVAPAIDSFQLGFEVALLVGGVMLLVACAIAVLDLRRLGQRSQARDDPQERGTGLSAPSIKTEGAM